MEARHLTNLPGGRGEGQLFAASISKQSMPDRSNHNDGRFWTHDAASALCNPESCRSLSKPRKATPSSRNHGDRLEDRSTPPSGLHLFPRVFVGWSVEDGQASLCARYGADCRILHRQDITNAHATTEQNLSAASLACKLSIIGSRVRVLFRPQDRPQRQLLFLRSQRDRRTDRIGMKELA